MNIHVKWLREIQCLSSRSRGHIAKINRQPRGYHIRTFANSEYPNEMRDNECFNQSLH